MGFIARNALPSLDNCQGPAALHSVPTTVVTHRRDTIFEGTRKQLLTWFQAMWFVTNRKILGQCAWASADAESGQLADSLDLAV